MQKLVKTKSKNNLKSKRNVTIMLHLYKSRTFLLTDLRKMY